MTTKATKHVLELENPVIDSIVIQGTGSSSIDNVPIGVTTPNVGNFTNLSADSLTVTTTADFTGANVIGLQSYYADFAEWFISDCDLEPGDVVSILPPEVEGEAEITNFRRFGENRMLLRPFGVVSEYPALSGNAGVADRNDSYLVAMIGRVPVKIDGAAKRGEYIVAVNGRVFASKNPITNHVIGRALENGEGLVNAVVMIGVGN